MYSTDGNLFSALDEMTPANYTFELQVCNAITNSISANCTAGSMINQINPDGSCYSFGLASVGVFNQNPYDDGAYIATYNGDALDHVNKYSSNLYLICGNYTPPVYEHMKTTYQVHFNIQTPLACSP